MPYGWSDKQLKEHKRKLLKEKLEKKLKGPQKYKTRLTDIEYQKALKNLSDIDRKKLFKEVEQETKDMFTSTKKEGSMKNIVAAYMAEFNKLFKERYQDKEKGPKTVFEFWKTDKARAKKLMQEVQNKK